MGQYFVAGIGPPIDPGHFLPVLCVDPHDFGEGLKLREHAWVGNPVMRAAEERLLGWPRRVLWVGDSANEDLYSAVSALLHCAGGDLHGPIRYVVNHERNEYVDLRSCPASVGGTVHPLALLTATGGYSGADARHVGRWARQLVSVRLAVWAVPEGYEELLVGFIGR